MAKANQKNKKVANKPELMNENFDQLLGVLDDLKTNSEEIMPLFSASIELSMKIARTYKKAFNAGKKYVK